MGTGAEKTKGPDLEQGIDAAELKDGDMLAGHVGGEPVLLARRGDEVFAIGSVCTHYGAPLAEGLILDDTVRCPWHHACFSLRTGEALRAPALDPVSRWRTEQRDGKVYVREKLATIHRRSSGATSLPESVVIVGGGGAGNAAAELLRRDGYSGPITMLSADAALPCDRPNLSKGYLAGTADESSNPLRSPEFYRDQGIDLKLGARVTAIDPGNRRVELADGSHYSFGALVLATGASPVPLDVPGSNLPHVHYLRTLADSRAIVAEARASRRAVVIGASFIGLEVASSLRARNVEVHVVGREDARPMEHLLGAEIGDFLRKLHEEHGVTFHFGTTVTSIDARSVTLKNGEVLEADFVVVGIGVKPSTSLAEKAGLAIDRGVLVNEYLETSAAGIYAAGDIARWPDALSGERIRVEHWVVAERQGQTAARNILGQRERFAAVPFFWTEQYDLGLAYVGHAEKWDAADIDGQLDARKCTVTYRRQGRRVAEAFIHRDLEGLHAEVELERESVSKAKNIPFADARDHA
jgi:NADPH-dependent 2,4-dienoyl-CoA reductase/sulfur reductase-like enzyme/nitrite reductase/ring-hydroxylating ferredoxin subunit